MHKMMFPLAIAIGLGCFAAEQASAQETVYFYTQIDQATADTINNSYYYGYQFVSPDEPYYGYYQQATGRSGRTKGGGQSVQFGVFFNFIDSGLFGDGNLDSSGAWIDANKYYFRDFDLIYRMPGKLSLSDNPHPVADLPDWQPPGIRRRAAAR